eukprot:GHRR01020804.1.p1 GENE.GHRR01020804.1~~GHRR01020804.1.p1  ORF type:complete len:436 (+),score=101.62 GHRR01020804.1:188-1495(+)
MSLLNRSRMLLPTLMAAATPQIACVANFLSLCSYVTRSRKNTKSADGSLSASDASPPGLSTGGEPVAAMQAADPETSQTSTNGQTIERLKALNTAMQKLNKKLGSGTIMRLGEQPVSAADCMLSGCLSLDIALGGGWPRGRIVEIFGPESSGKSTLALHAIAEVQKAGGQAVLIDAEHAFNRDFAGKLGVNLKELAVCQPGYGEEALEVVDTVLRSNAVDLIVVDSVAALLPRAEQEGDMGQTQVAAQARLMSYACRKLAPIAAKAHCTVIFINQLRHKVGVIYGNPETTSGGNALKFYASVRVDVRAREKVKGPDKTEVGVRVRAKVVKNKVAPPYRSAEFVILFNKGIDQDASLLEACEMLGLIQAKGSHYYYNDERIGHGREAVASALADNAALKADLLAQFKEKLQQAPSLEAGLRQHSVDDDQDGGLLTG